jgi:hypothetical protein
MRTVTMLVALIFTSAAVACAVWLGQSTSNTPVAAPERKLDDWPEPSATGPHPRAVAVEPTYDFGKALPGEQQSHTFVIRNEGQADLVLAKGHSSCRCTLSELAERSIPPGQAGEVTLTWTPEQPMAEFLQAAEIRTNDPENRSLRLTIKGKIEDLIRLEPSDNWTAGQVSAGQPTVLTGTITSGFLEEFTIHEIQTGGPLVQAEAIPLDAAALAEKGAVSGYTIKVTLLPGGATGDFAEFITLHTDIRGGTDLKIGITGTRQGALNIVQFPGTRWTNETKTAGLGIIPSSAGRTGTLFVFIESLPDGQPAEMELVEKTPEFLQVTLERDTNFQAENRSRYRLVLGVPAGLPAMTRTRENAGTVKLKTNHPGATELTIRVAFVIQAS